MGKNTKRDYAILIFANGLLVTALIALYYKDVVPLGVPDFVFVAVLVLLFAFYRPRWLFYLFIGLIPLELINLAPEVFTLHIRPYQLVGSALLVAVLYKIFMTCTSLHLPRLTFYDYALSTVALAGIPALLMHGADPQYYIIVASFFCLYFLTRIMVHKKSEIKKITPFFLTSAIIVTLFGIFQNWRFMQDLSHGEFFPGRPNATFTEPDWLGIYLVLTLALCYAAIFYLNGKNARHRTATCRACALIDKKQKRLPQHALARQGMQILRTSALYNMALHPAQRMQFVLSCGLVAVYVLLVITVARSAWIGAVAVMFLFLLLTTLRTFDKKRNWYGGLKAVATLALTILIGINIALSGSLTNFELGKRVASTGGNQEITLACASHDGIAAVRSSGIITDVTQLAVFNCEHINLEEITERQRAGYIVAKVDRVDPNITVRKEVYMRSWEEIKKHWLFGIGWGSASTLLGNDPHGTPLNSSNIFLQVTLATGIVGSCAFLVFISGLFFTALRDYFTTTKNQTLSVLTILTLSALIIPNLFNAGLLLGFVWVLFGVVVSTQRT